MIVRGNAELQRNLWLEITTQRLIAAPAIVGLIVIAAWYGARGEAATALRYIGAIGFVATAVLWGARLAAQSLSEEFAEGTWDGQRISGLSAAQMLAGKLLGGAAFAWYAGGWCLLVFALGALGSLGFADTLRVLAGLLLLALLAQALALLSTLLGWRRLRRVGDSRRRGLGVLLLVFFASPLARFAQNLGAGPRWLVWFDRPWPAHDFALASLAAFTAWALLGAHRAMRAELQFRDRPWIWIAFVLFLQVYAAGWIGSVRSLGSGALAEEFGTLDQPLLLRLMLASAIALLLAYLFVFAESKSLLRFRRLLADWRARRYAECVDSLPFWSINAAIAVLSTTLLLAATAITAPDGIRLLAPGLLAILLYAVRDFALVLWCNLGAVQRRADGAAAIYLLVLYLLLPALLAAVRLGAALGLALPWPAFSNPMWLLPAALWAIAGADLLWRRWRAATAAEPPET